MLFVRHQRQTGTYEAASAHAEPATVHLKPISTRQFDAIELEGDAARSGDCRLDSLRHQGVKLTGSAHRMRARNHACR